MPYDESDAMIFFGREVEQQIFVANLRAYPLTVLYGATGVGKTSLLRAGVAHSLRQFAADNVAEGGLPELAIAVVSNWRDNPLKELRQRVEEAVRQVHPNPEALAEPAPEKLDEALTVWAEQLNGPILVILDQFEEYFLYQDQQDGDETFVSQFAHLAASPKVPANFLIAIREDALAWLDQFKTRLPNLLDNILRVKHLDRESARRAITRPLEGYNRDRSPDERVGLERGLVDRVLDDVRFGLVGPRSRGRGLIGQESAVDSLQGAIETPYLQLVMRRLWDTEMAHGSQVLRIGTLTNELGGAGNIVRTHLDDSMDKLSGAEQRVAAAVFQYLVTPSGTKFAHIVPDLSQLAGLPEHDVAPVLGKLAERRILRQVPPASNQGSVLCYEIFHDVLAPAILDWRARQVEQAEREELRRQLERQQLEEQERRRQAEERGRLDRSNALATEAMSQLSVDPELSLLLAVEAVSQSETPLARNALRQALLECRIRKVLRGHVGVVSQVAFSPDGNRIVTAGQDATARIWNAESGAELAKLEGHEDWVWSAVFSPDGGRIVTASGDATARIWDARSGTELATLDGHGGAVRGASFSPDGQRIVTASDDGTARVWDGHGRSRRPMLLRGHSDQVRVVVFSPDGGRIVTGGFDREARVWDADTGQELAVLRGHTALLWGVAVSPDGRLAATASQDRTAAVWQLASGRLLRRLEGHNDEVWSAVFSPDSERVVTASFDQTARIWDARSGRSMAELRGHLHSVYSASFSPDGRWVLTGSLDNTARVFEADTARTIIRLRGHARGVNYAVFSPDGRRVATTSVDSTARLWDADTSQTVQELRGHKRPVLNVAFSPDGRRLVTSSGDDTARIWDVATGLTDVYLTGHRREVSSAVFSPDGERVVTASWDGTAAIRGARNGKILVRLAGHTREVSSVTFSPDGTRVVTGSLDGTARIWRADGSDSGTTERILIGHEGAVRSVAFSPDGTHIATGGSDRTWRLWNSGTGKMVAEYTAHAETLTTVGFSPDGRWLITGSTDRTARTWDIEAGRTKDGFRGKEFRGHTGRVYGAAFSPDGTRVVTASEDRTAIIWDASDGRPLAELRGHAGPINTAAVSSYGGLVATGSDDGSARIYKHNVQTSLDDLLARARERVTRALTPEERDKYVGDDPSLPTKPREIISG
jgi:WD40 repeat protein